MSAQTNQTNPDDLAARSRPIELLTENGYSIVRPDSRGLSRVLDPQGRTLAQADFFTTEKGYPAGLEENGIATRDMVWMARDL